MPFPYFEGISTDFTGTWTSPRKRKPTTPNIVPEPPKRKTNATPCPHSMTILRSTRQLVDEKDQCPICFDDYFSSPAGRDQVMPVRMGCSHIFCRECIEAHISSSSSVLKCPLPWCEARLPLLPDTCQLCAAFEKDNAAVGSLMITVRANEMLGSIKDALQQLAEDDEFYDLPKETKDRLFAHLRSTLKRYEWQFHSGIDVSELLDPFLMAVDTEAVLSHYGHNLRTPAPDPSRFPLRTNDPDDYETGQEPWIAAFLRQWALEYEQANGEVKEGWGVWARKFKKDEDMSWEWPYKRIIAHKTGEDGTVEYLVKWVGQRYHASWLKKESLVDGAREAYDKLHEVIHEDEGGSRKKRRKLPWA